MFYEILFWFAIMLYACFTVLVIYALRNMDEIWGAIKRAVKMFYARFIDRRPEAIKQLISWKAMEEEKREKETEEELQPLSMFRAAAVSPKLQPRPQPQIQTKSQPRSIQQPRNVSVDSIPLPPQPIRTTDAQKQHIADELFAFKMELLRKFPFYGDIVMRLEIIEDTTIPTACTDGKCIRYNPDFFATMVPSEYCFVLMHEVMHALLHHPTRVGNRDPQLWNVACDFIVNEMLRKLTNSFKFKDVNITQPAHALVLPYYVLNQHSVETLYDELYNQHKNRDKGKDHITFTYKSYGSNSRGLVIKLPSDMIFRKEMSDSEKQEIESAIKKLLMESGAKNIGSGTGDAWIPDELLVRKESKKLPWKVLLREYLEDGEYDEYSYFTPERKYIHMDLILPGPGERTSELGEIWAFIDDSGSITPDEMGEFLTQLYRILKEFSGTMHVAFWNTVVDATYRNIQNYKDIDHIKPKGSGGTDINCVYDYIEKNNIRPEVMLILTDDYYGAINESHIRKALKQNTIVVLTKSGDRNTEIAKKIGKVASL